MKITNQNPYQPRRLAVLDLAPGDAFVLATGASSPAPTVYILLSKTSRNPEDGPEGHCLELLPSLSIPIFRSLHLHLDAVKIRLTRLDIELLPREQA